MRQPSVAGQFYERTKDALLEQVKECFLSDFGPKELPKQAKVSVHGVGVAAGEIKPVLGAISPHAGFMFSGPAAAFVYKTIAELPISEKPDLFIILGPTHTGLGRTSFMADDFQTPLGIAKVDNDFAKLLSGQDSGSGSGSESGSAAIVEDSRAHLHEHSIEVQLPFLQFIYADSSSGFKFMPIVISSEVNIDSVADSLRKAVEEYEASGKRVCIIASSDFTHYGYNYGYTPFGSDAGDSSDSMVRKNLKALDMGAIDLIRKLDYEKFLKYVKQTGATICGFLPIYVMLKVLKEKNRKTRGKTEGKNGSVLQKRQAKRAELLTYYTSGDVIGDYSSSVSYAGIVVE